MRISATVSRPGWTSAIDLAVFSKNLAELLGSPASPRSAEVSIESPGLRNQGALRS